MNIVDSRYGRVDPTTLPKHDVKVTPKEEEGNAMNVSTDTLLMETAQVLISDPMEVIPDTLGIDAMDAIASVGLPPMDAATLLAGVIVGVRLSQLQDLESIPSL